MRRLSIQLKVTLWFTLLMVALVGVVLAFLFYAGSQSALAATQSLMTGMVQDAWREIEAEDGRLDIDNDLEYFKNGVYLSVYDGGGVPQYGAVPREFDNSAAFEDGLLRTEDGAGKQWYVYDAQTMVSGFGTVWIRSVAAVEDIDSTISTLLQLALVVLPFFVVLAALGGYLITRRAFHPIRRITQTAREIGEGDDLSRRIALGQGRDEVYTLAAEFDRMFARLEEAFESERQFTSDASHELRTPTAVMISQCEYALEHAATLDDARQALGAVLNQAERMAALIAQLLMLARTDKRHKKLNLETVDLSELASMVAEEQQEAAAARGIEVVQEIQPGIVLRADETMLMRMLINLMENGIRYGRDGGMLRVSLQERDGLIRGAVRDNGIGIAPEHLPQVWKRFWQADPARGSQGAGLGLSMVKWIVEAHGGAVGVNSIQGEGSEFFFTLPADKADGIENRA